MLRAALLFVVDAAVGLGACLAGPFFDALSPFRAEAIVLLVASPFIAVASYALVRRVAKTIRLSTLIASLALSIVSCVWGAFAGKVSFVLAALPVAAVALSAATSLVPRRPRADTAPPDSAHGEESVRSKKSPKTRIW